MANLGELQYCGESEINNTRVGEEHKELDELESQEDNVQSEHMRTILMMDAYDELVIDKLHEDHQYNKDAFF